MTTSKRKNLLSALEQYYNDLKSYSDILKHLTESKTIMGHETRDRDKLRESLVRKTGVLKERIIEVTGKQYYEQFMSTYDMWNEAFNPASFLPTPSNRTALAFCINATNEAIGKLESDIRLGIRDKQGNLIKIEKPTSSITEPPKAFISHGKKSAALTKLKEFLRALGVELLIVKELPSMDKTVDDKVNFYLGQADFVIILATGDDEIEGKLHPRQNVIHEIGLAQKTHTGKIIYLLEEGAEFPSNIRPKVWERFKQRNMMNAFLYIAKELRAYGILRAVKP